MAMAAKGPARGSDRPLEMAVQAAAALVFPPAADPSGMVRSMTDPTPPPMPSNGRCLCGAVPFFQLAGRVGQAGHFHCRRCGARYRMADLEWTPGGPAVGAEGTEETGHFTVQT
jgi:hypothetical protein